MSHDCHEGWPGYSPSQILYDGCAECAMRSRDVSLAIGHLDPESFEQAWHRAIIHATGCLLSVSTAEVPLLKALWAVQVQLERRGVPIGLLPSGDTVPP